MGPVGQIFHVKYLCQFRPTHGSYIFGWVEGGQMQKTVQKHRKLYGHSRVDVNVYRLIPVL